MFLHLCSWILKPPAYKTRLQCHAVNCKSFVNHRLVPVNAIEWYKTSKAFTLSLWFHHWKKNKLLHGLSKFFYEITYLTVECLSHNTATCGIVMDGNGLLHFKNFNFGNLESRIQCTLNDQGTKLNFKLKMAH